jgi:hypothetical protein
MRGRINAQRQATDDGEPRGCERLGKLFRGLVSRRGRVATSDDGYCRRIQQIAPALVIQQHRRIADIEQRFGVVGVVPGQKMIARRGGPGKRARSVPGIAAVFDGARDSDRNMLFQRGR